MTEHTLADATSEGTESFDFIEHGRAAGDAYQRVRSKYTDLAEVARDIIQQCLAAEPVHVLSVQARSKDVDSFTRKAVLPSDADPDQPKYRDPMADITDLAGVRVITFFPRTVLDVDRIISDQFEIIEKSDKATQLRKEDRFGYQSVHYLARLSKVRTALPEYARLDGLVFELQVRTVLQHAWAEIEHDIQYKSVSTIPADIRRRFGALAGMLEIADREFQAIQDEDERLRVLARESVAEGRLEDVELTPDALKAYLDQRFGPDGRVTAYSYQHAAETLRLLGFATLGQLDDCLRGYDDDFISRVLWGTRQGQLTRLEEVLLASMGDEYIRRHPWGIYLWFMKSRLERLDVLIRSGISIGSYRPSPDVLDGKHVVMTFAIANIRSRSPLDVPDQVRQLLIVLPALEAKIIGLTYGLEGGRNYTADEIGALLGIPKSTVDAVLSKGLDRLKSVGIDTSQTPGDHDQRSDV